MCYRPCWRPWPCWAVLLFVDNLSQAALAAGLGSSVVILFLHPSRHSASPRALIGGHGLGLLLGSAFAVLLFASPVETFLEDLSPVRDLGLAISVGLLILGMAITGTEHPPAAGTVWAWQPGHGTCRPSSSSSAQCCCWPRYSDCCVPTCETLFRASNDAG